MIRNSSVTADFNELASCNSEDERSSFRQSIISDCLNGKIVILKNVDLGADLADFDMHEMFPSSLCKIGMICGQDEVESAFHASLPVRLVYPGAQKLENPYISDRDLTHVCSHSFGGDWSRFRSFLGSCETALGNLRDVARHILQEHQYDADCPVMRFSLPGGACPMHLDPNPNWAKKEAIRIFANVDDRPRQWRYSANIFELVENEYYNLGLGRFFTSKASDRFIKLAKVIMRSSELQNYPIRSLELQPGDVWLFDGRIIAHQLVAGRRALSLTTKISNSGLPAYHRPLRDRLTAIHERKQRQMGSSLAHEQRQIAEAA